MSNPSGDPVPLSHKKCLAEDNSHCKKELAVFPSPAGMSLIKLFLGGNNLVFSRPERVWSVTSRLGTGKWLTLFYSAGSLTTVFSNVVQFQLNILCQILQRSNSFAVIDDSQISFKYRNPQELDYIRNSILSA
jgi:hypothetical protein